MANNKWCQIYDFHIVASKCALPLRNLRISAWYCLVLFIPFKYDGSKRQHVTGLYLRALMKGMFHIDVIQLLRF